MKINELWSRLDAYQNRRSFKIAATVAVVIAVIAGLIAYMVARNVPALPTPGPAAATTAQPADEQSLQVEAVVNSLLAARADPTQVAVGMFAAGAILIAAIWLGLAITVVVYALGAAVVLGPLALAGLDGAARLVGGTAMLLGCFTVLLRIAAGAFALSHPVTAVARNILAEAVRMRISLVFIVLLAFATAAIPSLFEPETPLRYRVQSFLQYGTGVPFWLTAILTLLFSVSSVTTEQRQKVIWQTMTKPVTAWHYVLGKWLGVSTLGAILLAVCGVGVFLFTEHLRSLPAMGEREAFVARDGAISEDRLLLENQVLVARVRVQPDPYPVDEAALNNAIEQRINDERLSSPNVQSTPEMRQKIRDDLLKSIGLSYRTIEAGSNETYVFSGLSAARDQGAPLTLRYRVESPSAAPWDTFRLSFSIGGGIPQIEPSTISYNHTITLLPTAVNSSGQLVLTIVNGDLNTQRPNPRSINFPQDAFEVSYAVGGYRANFFRVMAVLWLKIVLLSITGICAATFLSFPVACLVAFAVFLGAETSGFLRQSLHDYQITTPTGQLIWHRVVIDKVSQVVATAFSVYADLKPTKKLVDGQMLAWSDVAVGVGVLGLMSSVLFATASFIFRRRELAVYSGNS